jgi:hypothetical protein
MVTLEMLKRFVGGTVCFRHGGIHVGIDLVTNRYYPPEDVSTWHQQRLDWVEEGATGLILNWGVSELELRDPKSWFVQDTLEGSRGVILGHPGQRFGFAPKIIIIGPPG